MKRRILIQKGTLALLFMFGVGELCAYTSDDYIELIHDCRVGNVEGVEQGLQKGIDVNQSDGNGWTPLFHAAVTGHLPVVELLVERGANLTIVRLGGNETSLNYAIQSGNGDLIRYLLDRGGEGVFNSASPHSGLPILVAPMLDNLEALKIFHEYGVDYTAVTVSALIVAALHLNPDCVRYLIQMGMDPNQPAPRGNHVLSLAAMTRRPDMVSLLLDAGANPNAISSGVYPSRAAFMGGQRFGPTQHTALTNAVLENDPATVQLLLEKGADPSLLDHRAIKFADMIGNQELYTLLVNHGASEPPPYGFAHLDLFRPLLRDDSSRASQKPEADWGLRAVLNQQTMQRPAPDRAREPLSIAVLSKDHSTESVGDLLSTSLSQTDGYMVLERQQIHLLAQEQLLQPVFMLQAEHSIRAGELLGVDALALLEADDHAITASLIAVSTGLVMDTMVYAVNAPHHQVAEDFHTRIDNVSHLLNAAPDDWLLFSIPYIIGIQTDDDAGSVQRRFSNALAIYLGAQENTYILGRSEMRRLAVEGALQGSVREFYASGWLIDGSFEIDRDVHETLTVVLRLRQPGSNDEIVISESAALKDISLLLSAVTRNILAKVRDASSAEVNLEEEARAYLEQAQRAYRANLWEYAHLSADAAWVLGKRSDTLTDILLRSLIHRIRISRQSVLDTTIGRRIGWDRMLASRAPLLFPKGNSRELSADDYLNLADDILDLYEPLLQKNGDFTPFELDLLAFYPIALRAAITPAIYLQSLSDRRTYGTRLDPLIHRMRRQTLRARALAKQNDHAVLYQLLTVAYAEQLPYWIDDDDAIYDEMMEIFREANHQDLPYQKHTIYNGCRTVILKSAPEPRSGVLNSATGRAQSTWSRMLPRFAKSEILEVALLGHDLMRLNTDSQTEKHRLTEAIRSLLLELIPLDDSMTAGMSWRNQVEIPADLNIRGAYSKDPSFTTRALWFPCPLGRGSYRRFDLSFSRETPDWYPSDQIDAKKYAGRLELVYGPEVIADLQMWTELQIDTMAENGKPTSLSLSPNPNVFSDPERVQRLIDRLHESRQKIEVRCAASGYFGEMPQYLLRRGLYIHRFETRLEEMTQVAAEPARVVLELDNFQIPFHHVNASDGYMPSPPLDQILTSSGDSHFWIGWRTFGFQMYNLDAEAIETAVLPRGYQMYHLHPENKAAIGDDYIATWLLRRERGLFPTTIGVYDRKSGTWELLPVHELEYSPRNWLEYSSRRHGVHQLHVLGDYVVYSYITNPDHNLRNASSQRVYNDPGTVMGVSCINIKTGAHRTLVNNRRTPSQSPLDDFPATLYNLRVLDDDSILCEGYIYNLVRDEWVKATGAENPRPSSLDPWFKFQAEYGSTVTRSYHSHRDQGDLYTVSVYSNGNRTRRKCVLTLVPKDWSTLEIPSELTEVQRAYDGMKSFPVLDIDVYRHGLLLRNSMGFYFVPLERFSDTLKRALEVQHE